MGTARELIPDGASLEELRSLAAGCQACDLYRNATQPVFGEGSAGATVHPSSILRALDDHAREAEMEAFVADLAVVASHLAAAGSQ